MTNNPWMTYYYWLGPAQGVHFFYKRLNLSALQSFALNFSTNFSLFSHLKNQQSNSYKNVRKFTKQPLIVLIFSVYWLNGVVRFLNVKINWNWLRNLMQKFTVHSNESACRKSGRLGLDQVNSSMSSRDYFS